MHELMKVPDELELLEFFCSEPVEQDKTEGLATYEFRDNANVTIRFGYFAVTGSIFVSLTLDDRLLSSFTQEGTGEVVIRENTLLCSLSSKGYSKTLIVKLEPYISVEWIALAVYV